MTASGTVSDQSHLIGLPQSELETPCLCLDLSTFEANVKKASEMVRAAGKNWRPHAKCHKSVDIAKRIVQSGAVGVTCAKVSEAEVYAAVGVTDILIAHLPVGAGRVRRVAELCKIASPIVSCDHYVQAQGLSEECTRLGVTCRAVVDINIGMDRTGVRPGRDALELAKGIEKLPGLKLAGIMGYEGHVMGMTDGDEKRKAIEAALGILSHIRDLYRSNSLCCDIVSAGGTGSLREALACEALTEVQSGGAIFGDPFYSRMPNSDGFASALTVLTTVVSRPSFDRAVLDAGRKAITAEIHPPLVKDWDDANIVMHSAEHIVVQLGPNSLGWKIGDQIELIVGYADLTTMLYDNFICIRNGNVEAVWPISARGKLV